MPTIWSGRRGSNSEQMSGSHQFCLLNYDRFLLGILHPNEIAFFFIPLSDILNNLPNATQVVIGINSSNISLVMSFDLVILPLFAQDIEQYFCLVNVLLNSILQEGHIAVPAEPLCIMACSLLDTTNKLSNELFNLLSSI